MTEDQLARLIEAVEGVGRAIDFAGLCLCICMLGLCMAVGMHRR